MRLAITTLPGDGIGPEVTAQAVRVLSGIADIFGHSIQCQQKLIGGAALQSNDNTDSLPAESLQACLASGAVLLGAVGSPAFDSLPPAVRPEAGLLRLRRELGAYANLRPAVCFPALEDCSPLRTEIVHATDFVIVRELLGGIYFGQPRRTEGASGARCATDTMQYREPEIERIAHVAFELARSRRGEVTSVDKANVLDCSRLWREVVTRVSKQYPSVSLRHMYVDSASMALVSHPASFDVLLTENMFGDILSDQAGAIIGSIGMLASASLGGPVGLYEPVHGSAPDIAGKGIANPLGAILSAALMLRHSFHLEAEAACIEASVQSTLNAGYRTADIAASDCITLSTAAMGDRVLAAIQNSVREPAAAQ
jgi:3-isopropylmalate dehydrogenase